MTPVHGPVERATFSAGTVSDNAPQSLASLSPGDTLDRYELLCPIAEGGMASVWAARLSARHGFEKLVAIKTILPKFAGDARFRAMFVDEARIAARVDHPNVAQVFDLGEDRGAPYLVMEYVDGDSLSKLNRACQRRGAQIPAGVLLRVLADACAGLHEAHEMTGENGKPLGIVHRDISPHNVLCSTRGVVKLVDFGIAKSGSDGGDQAESGVLKGKIQYMAPEQALGKAVDRRADLWGVGAILYHVLAGKAPYEGDTQLAMLHMLGSGVPPQALPPDVHPAIAALARKALALDPAKRYATAAELRDAIERTMVVAQVVTTAADVGAFSMRFLAERAQRRRDAIDRGLAASAKRGREQGAGEPTAAALEGSKRPPSDAAGDRTDGLPEAGPDAPAGASDPPPGATSYATLGSAALVASAPVTAIARARKSTVTALAIGAGIAAVTVASLGVSRARQHATGAPAPTIVALAAPPPVSAPPRISPSPPISPPAETPSTPASAPAVEPPGPTCRATTATCAGSPSAGSAGDEPAKSVAVPVAPRRGRTGKKKKPHAAPAATDEDENPY
jgi:eukaryotic-like serine/threonine-protein kinase